MTTTVQVPVCRTVAYCESVPVSRTVCRVVREDHTAMVTKQHCYRVPVEMVQQIPYTTCRVVREDHTTLVTKTRCYTVPETHTRYVPYTTCRVVPETHTRLVTRRHCYNVPETRTVQIPYTTCRVVKEDHVSYQTRRACRMVPETVVQDVHVHDLPHGASGPRPHPNPPLLRERSPRCASGHVPVHTCRVVPEEALPHRPPLHACGTCASNTAATSRSCVPRCEAVQIVPDWCRSKSCAPSSRLPSPAA